LCGGAWGQVSWHVLTADSDLIARYNGDGNNDGTPDAINAANPGTHDGSWSGTAAYTSPHSGNGKAFDFDGSSYIGIASYPGAMGISGDSGGFTFCARYTPASVS